MPSNPITADTEYSNIAESQEKDLKTACMKMIELHKENQENTV